MQILPNPFEWYPRDTLRWPSYDEKLQQVNSWVSDIDLVMRHVRKSEMCLQAGGACGVWPARLAGYFDEVRTWEPNPDNYACLLHNIEPYDNIAAYYGALGSSVGRASIARDAFETKNAGAWYTVPGNDFFVGTIDSLQLSKCDLIMLDVEGAELDVLTGASNTLSEHHPVVVIETKDLPHMSRPASAAADFIAGLGYRKVAKYHNDLVFVC